MGDAPSQKVTPDAAELLAAQPVFGDLLTAEERQTLMDYSHVRQTPVGAILCQQGQLDERVFILLLGEVEVTSCHGEQNTSLARLGRGEIFGEISALFKMPRISSVTVTKPSVVLDMPGEVFEEVIHSRPLLRDAVWQRYHRRLMETALRRVDQFRSLPAEVLASLQESLALVSFPKDTMVVDEGSPGDALYIIISGTAQVCHQVNGKLVKLALLSPGEYFGEWSLLTGAPCAATVLAQTRLDAFCIERPVFLRFIQDHPSIRDRIDLLAHNRHSQATMLDSVPIGGDHYSSNPQSFLHSQP